MDANVLSFQLIINGMKERGPLDCLRQWLTADSFSRQEELIFADCDRNRRARLSTLLSLAAATAGHDYDARGLPYEKLYAQREVFLLSRLSLNVHAFPMAGEVLTVTTWEDGVKGAQLQRVFEVRDEAKRLRVSMRSDWVLVDPETRKILRPAAFTGKTITVCPQTIDCPACKKVTLPREGLDELGRRTVVWSDLDGNGHVYSGNYGDILWDFLPADLQEKPLRQCFINYSKEATLGTELTLMGQRDGAVYRMEGVGPGGVCFTGECIF